MVKKKNAVCSLPVGHGMKCNETAWQTKHCSLPVDHGMKAVRLHGKENMQCYSQTVGHEMKCNEPAL
jgi:hypothetical protein